MKRKTKNRIKWLSLTTVIAFGLFASIYWGVLPAINKNSPPALTNNGFIAGTSYKFLYTDQLDPTNHPAPNLTVYVENTPTTTAGWSDFATFSVLSGYSAVNGNYTAGLTPVAGKVYLFKIWETNNKVETQWYSSNSNLFGGRVPYLQLGTNTIALYNMTSLNIAASMLQTTSLATQFNNTKLTNWDLTINYLNGSASSTNTIITYLEGIQPYYDPSVGSETGLMMLFTSNITATSAMVSSNSFYGGYGLAQTSGDVSTAILNTALIGSTTVPISFGSGIGTTFSITQIEIGFGNMISSVGSLITPVTLT